MKKIIILSVMVVGLLSFCPDIGAQTTMTNPNGLTLDTVTQAAAEGPTVNIRGYQSTSSFTLVLTKISGTIAGTVVLQGSNRNTAASFSDIPGTDTLTLVDATASYCLVDTPKNFLYYRVLIRPTGTWSASYSGTSYATKE